MARVFGVESVFGSCTVWVGSGLAIYGIHVFSMCLTFVRWPYGRILVRFVGGGKFMELGLELFCPVADLVGCFFLFVFLA